jgi:hypothetical protein
LVSGPGRLALLVLAPRRATVFVQYHYCVKRGREGEMVMVMVMVMGMTP